MRRFEALWWAQLCGLTVPRDEPPRAAVDPSLFDGVLVPLELDPFALAWSAGFAMDFNRTCPSA